MNPSILAHRKRIDHLFTKITSIKEPEMQNEWSKYLCVMVSGFIEESLRALLGKYCENKASKNIENFITNYLGAALFKRRYIKRE